MEPLYGKLKTTVIGSFPLEHSFKNMRRALSDQVSAGINFPSYGQLLDMNMMFLEPLTKEGCGIEIIEGEAWITGALKPPRKPVNLEFLKLAQEYLQDNPSETVDGVKVPVTGPITLASVTKVSDKHNAIEYPDFILGFSEIVAEMVRWYDRAGAGMITLDEPSLGYALWTGVGRDVVLEAIDKPIKAIKNAISSIHVCGDIAGAVDVLVETKASVLHHSFKDFPKNLEAYDRRTLEKTDKMIGLGCVSSTPDPQLLLDIRDGKVPWTAAVEPVGEIEKLIFKGGERFGFERLVVNPDCGFRGLKDYFGDDTGQLIAVQKLKRMVEATQRVRAQSGLGQG